MNYSFECPKCGEEITAEVDVGEHLIEWGEECEECGYKFSHEEVLKIYEKALEDCHGFLTDWAHEMSKG